MEQKLYHYTNLAGIEGILRSGLMHATHVGHLNDTSERRLFIGIITNFLREFLLSKTPNNSVGYAVLERVIINLKEEENTDYYVTSFSKSREDLDQYVKYSGPSGGAISASVENIKYNIEEYNINTNYEFILGDCIYVDPRHPDEIDNIEFESSWFTSESASEKFRGNIRQFVELLNFESGEHWPGKESLKDHATHGITRELSVQSALYKHVCFKSENESRIVAWKHKRYRTRLNYDIKVEYKNSDVLINPYIKYPIVEATSFFDSDNKEPSKCLFEEVILSPSEKSRKNVNSVGEMLRSMGVSISNVSVSDLPFVFRNG